MKKSSLSVIFEYLLWSFVHIHRYLYSGVLIWFDLMKWDHEIWSHEMRLLDHVVISIWLMEIQKRDGKKAQLHLISSLFWAGLSKRMKCHILVTLVIQGLSSQSLFHMRFGGGRWHFVMSAWQNTYKKRIIYNVERVSPSSHSPKSVTGTLKTLLLLEMLL